MSRRLDLSSLAKLSTNLRRLPKELGARIAQRAAPLISSFSKGTFDSSADPYGVPWAPGAEGQRVTLRKSGALERFVVYVAIGTRLRSVLGVPYAKYQIGKRNVYPRAGAILPRAYSDALEKIATTTAQEFIDEAKR